MPGNVAMMSTPSPRSLADQLRAWPDDRLARLLTARPDLGTPAPQDSSQLASRAATRASLLRALDLLTRAELATLDALVLLGEGSVDDAASIVHAERVVVAAAVDRLVDLALVWESPSGLRPLSGVADALRGSGSGLQPGTGETLDIAAATARLEQTSPAGRALLEHLDTAGGLGTSGSAAVVPVEQASNPVEEALARGLLLRRDRTTVVLPWTVGVALRGGRTTTEPVGTAPEIAWSTREQAMVDRAAAGAAFEAVRRVELLLDRWGTHPPVTLRTGGLGVRDLKAAAAELAVDESAAALLIEVASAAGLLTQGTTSDGEAAWLPTDTFDVWSTRSGGTRWEQLVRAWLDTPRVAGLVGGRDGQDKPVNALVPELAMPMAVETRRMVLDELAALGDGAVLATGTGTPSVVDRLRWLRPRRPAVRDDLVVWTLREASALGLLGLGGLGSPARALLAGDDAAQLLDPLLPAEVDHVLLQADLTAVAPGPLETELARRLQAVADVESRGGATVYRFTASSVRRAFDAGWSALEVHDFVGSISRTPVPQPLTYLIDDTSRTFGSIRVGAVEAFLRADDEHALTELLHLPAAAALGLRRIAPTVLVSSTPIDVLLPRLRELGAAPVVEAADGTVHVARPDHHRARTPKGRRSEGMVAARATAQLTAVVTAIRAGDRAAGSRPAGTTTLNPASSLAALRQAIEQRQTVRIAYVDNHGSATERIIDPVSVEGGSLVARDHRSEERRSFAVHRIRSVTPVATDPS